MVCRVGAYKVLPHENFINISGFLVCMPSNPVKHRHEGLETIPAAAYTVTVKDVFKLDYLYIMLHDWLVDEGWAPRGNDAEFRETYYLQRETSFGKEIILRWRLLRDPPAAKSEVFKWMMDVDIKVLGLKPKEIVFKNQKLKLDSGEFEMSVKAYLVIDYGGKWEKSALKSLKKVWLHRVKIHQIGWQKRAIYGAAYRMRDVVMNYLKLETMFPEKETGEFYAKRTME